MIRVKDLRDNLDSCTKTLGLQASNKLIRKDGKVVHVSVGFDSPLLMLSPVVYIRTPQTKADLARKNFAASVEFHFGMNGTKGLEEFFTEVMAKGIAVISEPTQLNDPS